MNRELRKPSFFIFTVMLAGFLFSLEGRAQTHKGLTFQGVIKLPGDIYPTATGLSVNAMILSPDNCILREENFPSVDITNGYIYLVVGTGTVTGSDPGLTIKQVMDNSAVIANGPTQPTGLVCLDINGNVTGTTSFDPATTTGVRKFRIELVVNAVSVNADFHMRSVAYAVEAESLNGKVPTDFINTSASITQPAVETWFASAVMGQLLAGTFNSPTATNVSGTVDIANGGTGATTAVAARTNLELGSAAVLSAGIANGVATLDAGARVPTSQLGTGTADATTYLRGDGAWASIVSGVSSVAGKTGAVTLAAGDITSGTFDSARLPVASGTTDGIVNQIAQSFAGVKTFINNANMQGTLAVTGDITSSGNLGIGTPTPGAPLSIEQNSNTYATAIKIINTAAPGWDRGLAIEFEGASSAKLGKLRYNWDGASTSASNFNIQVQNGTLTSVFHASKDGNINIGSGSIVAPYSLGITSKSAGTATIGILEEPNNTLNGTDLKIAPGSPRSSGATDRNGGSLILSSGPSTGTGTSVITFLTPDSGVSGTASNAPSEKMRIDSTGNVGIGLPNPDERLVVFNGTTTGKYTSTGWTHSSDRRLKHDILPIENALEKILKLRGVGYKFKSDPENKTQVGFIAQEVEPIFPEVVVTDDQGFKSMIYGNLVAPVIEAVKTLYSRMVGIEVLQETQRRQIASIEIGKADKTEMNALKSKLDRLEIDNKNKDKRIKELEARLERIEKALSSQ